MKRFAAIEGLRGWLAWGVVLSHLPYMTGFQMAGVDPVIRSLGSLAIKVFIMVSGFVITHLIVEQRLPYGQYIVQRFMRLFPLFLVTSVIGFFTSDLLAVALNSDPTFSDPEQFNVVASDTAQSTHEYLRWHALVHLTMLHGLIPTTLLPGSDYAFNPPSWSISLEWQFYLIAPLLILVLREKPKLILALGIAIAVLEVLFRRYYGLEPRALPLGASLFAVGIISRLLFPEIENRNWFVSVLALAIVAFPLYPPLRPLLIWLVVLFGMANRSLASPSVKGAFDAVLASPVAKYFGARSFSVYLCHYFILSATVWVVFHYSGHVPSILLLGAIAIPITVLISELSYRFIEVPGIKLGRRLARYLRDRKSSPLPVASFTSPPEIMGSPSMPGPLPVDQKETDIRLEATSATR